jgi:hypothetical protein
MQVFELGGRQNGINDISGQPDNKYNIQLV